MKQIKDYIHHYLGCEVLRNGERWKLSAVFQDGTVLIAYKDLVITMRSHNKLLLRPLSDMTEEEVKELFQYDKISKEYHHISFHRDVGLNGVLNGITIYYKVQTDEGALFPMSWTLKFNSMNADDFAWCLKKGFDMFQLIPAGLAIDKTTLKEKI